MVTMITVIIMGIRITIGIIIIIGIQRAATENYC